MARHWVLRFRVTSSPVDVAGLVACARRSAECFDASYDHSARSHFRALVDHPNVDGDKLRALLDTLPFQSDEEWKATFEGALVGAKAEVGVSEGDEATAVCATFHFVSALLRMPIEECWQLYQEVRAEHGKHGEEALIPDIAPLGRDESAS